MFVLYNNYMESNLSFDSWLNPLFVIGHKRKLEEDDMYKVLTEDSSKVLGERLQWYVNPNVSVQIIQSFCSL